PRQPPAHDPADQRRDPGPETGKAHAHARLELARAEPRKPALSRPADAGEGEGLARPRAAYASGAQEAGLAMKRAGLVVLAALALTVPASGVMTSTPGMTASQIVIGGTVPLSGSASSFGVVGPSAQAYFKYVNAHGGVYGRKIKYIYRDDGYDPSRTVDETRRLVQQDKVFAIFNSVGTEHNLAVRGYLNAVKVPQLFVG